jgi:hypothetical protein
LTFSNGYIWVAYTASADNTLYLDCRDDRELATSTSPVYQEYHVPESSTTFAMSDHAPAIGAYDGQIYIAWIEKGGTKIKYQSTDGSTLQEQGGNWMSAAKTLDPEYTSTQTPVLKTCNGLLYISFLDSANEIYFGCYNGTYWSTPARQKLTYDPTYVMSPYPPSLCVVNSQTLRFFYGSQTDYSLWYADYVPNATTTPTEIKDATQWTTKLGSALADRRTEPQPWIFTVDPDAQTGIVSRKANAINMIAQPAMDTYSLVSSSTSSSAAFAYTNYQPASLLVPGIPGKSPSRIFVFWNDMTDKVLKEAAFQVEPLA